ncbi:hypothetical protein GGX14DRAFT_405038 [Mycena pura]|uniref:Uncharacterized protein n=1 Tax=Mycena pura TaxID=153505 RepID=A0AAD6Y110_9AGAR|nr:hypothetical protein GGX14DRAFT_405038 [Mycena pura]
MGNRRINADLRPSDRDMWRWGADGGRDYFSLSVGAWATAPKIQGRFENSCNANSGSKSYQPHKRCPAEQPKGLLILMACVRAADAAQGPPNGRISSITTSQLVQSYAFKANQSDHGLFYQTKLESHGIYNKIVPATPEPAKVSTVSGADSEAPKPKKAESGRSLRERTNKLQGVLGKQSSQVRRLIRECDALEDHDARRAIEADVGARKPSPRLVAIHDELEQVSAKGPRWSHLTSSVQHI